MMTSPTTLKRNSTTGRQSMGATARIALLSALSGSALVSAQSNCVSLQGSTTCSAFQSASVSTTGFVAGIFPFLQFVSNRETFDQQMLSYIDTTYVREKYQTLLGCSSVNLTQPDELYARFTTTVICNAIVQNSIDTCNLPAANSRPVCADTCAEFAQSEALLTSDSSLCGNPGSNLMNQIRADFTNCALPADSLSSSNCIQGIANERDNCGYGNSTVGLCSYCASGGINSTDTCCYNSNIDERCAGVTLPSIFPTMTFAPPTATATPTPSSTAAAAAAAGLSGGAIAGIVIGSVAGALLLAGLIYACILLARRRRRGSQSGSIFNQPSPSRQGPSTAKISPVQTTSGYEVLPGGRIARMSALESASDPAPAPPSRSSGPLAAAAAVGGAAGYMTGRRRGDDPSSSEFGDSPESEIRAGVLRPPPTNIRRTGSLSSSSVLADPQSPTSAGMSSPQGMASQQSEQLPFFKDYYSQDDIHPGDRVATLWAYHPRAPDEFALERGDMLKVVGIWDDGWATGVLMDEHADEWEARRQAQRDSGVSNTSGRQDPSPPVSGEIKAFPLVCVCLPEHWRKTIEGDLSTEGSSAHQGHPSFS
ncbi:SH3 domain-containing protein [Colletotrichum higginsianum IMI 349063]|uniref:SH3 domain-containing protein n=3 Tax=Colletotrichum higginsianum TaxID=80884 RepID=A0A1B7YKH7_COLHI|nr:SH3 domain-containing protein [Colletotrichum higginsianum IMI 349063]OBR12505.1 SH3 domain-containing protein [Colletotrichum higginsianum IMI 349063]